MHPRNLAVGTIVLQLSPERPEETYFEIPHMIVRRDEGREVAQLGPLELRLWPEGRKWMASVHRGEIRLSLTTTDWGHDAALQAGTKRVGVLCEYEPHLLVCKTCGGVAHPYRPRFWWPCEWCASLPEEKKASCWNCKGKEWLYQPDTARMEHRCLTTRCPMRKKVQCRHCGAAKHRIPTPVGEVELVERWVCGRCTTRGD